jgi:hypothetical protein
LEGDIFVFDPDRGFIMGDKVAELGLDMMDVVRFGSHVGEKDRLFYVRLSASEELVRYIVEAIYSLRRGGYEEGCEKGVGSGGVVDRLECDARDLCIVLNRGRLDGLGLIPSHGDLEWRRGLMSRFIAALRECPVCWRCLSGDDILVRLTVNRRSIATSVVGWGRSWFV